MSLSGTDDHSSQDVLEKLEDVLEKVVKEVEDNLLAKHLFFFF